jgi:hypothetical protein
MEFQGYLTQVAQQPDAEIVTLKPHEHKISGPVSPISCVTSAMRESHEILSRARSGR